jgi:hypothetical protein
MTFWGSVARFPVDLVLWHVDSFRGLQRPSVPYPKLDFLNRGLGCWVDNAGRSLMPVGECAYCDEQRASGNVAFPPHDPSDGCEVSSGDAHCYCDSCF